MDLYKFEELILDFRKRCLENDFAVGDLFWIDNYEFEVKHNKMERYLQERTRLEELEQEAKDRFIETVDWNHVIETLDEKEQKEYWRLMERVR